MSTHDQLVKQDAIEEADVHDALEEISRLENESTMRSNTHNELKAFIESLDDKNILHSLPSQKVVVSIVGPRKL